MRNLKQIRYNIYTLQRIITLSDQIIPSELLLSRARVPFFWFNKCKGYLGLKKMCKLVAGLLTKKCKLFSGRYNNDRLSMTATGSHAMA